MNDGREISWRGKSAGWTARRSAARKCYACQGYGHIAMECPSNRDRVNPERIRILKRKLEQREAEITDLKEYRREETEEELFARLEKKYRTETVVENGNNVGEGGAKTTAILQRVENENPEERIKNRSRAESEDDSDSGSESESSSSDSDSSSSGSDSDSSSSSRRSGKTQKPQVAGNVFVVENEAVVPKLVNPGDVVSKYGILLEFETPPDSTEWQLIPKHQN